MKSLFRQYLDAKSRVEDDRDLENSAEGTNPVLIPDLRGGLVSNSIGCFEVVENTGMGSHGLSLLAMHLSQTEASNCVRLVPCDKNDPGAELVNIQGVKPHYRVRVPLPTYQTVKEKVASSDVRALQRMADKYNCPINRLAEFIPSNGRPPRYISDKANFVTNSELDDLPSSTLQDLESAMRKLESKQKLEEREKDLLHVALDMVPNFGQLRPKLPELVEAARLREALLGQKVNDDLQLETDIIEQHLPEPLPISVLPQDVSLWARTPRTWDTFCSMEEGGQGAMFTMLNGDKVKATRFNLNEHFVLEGGHRLFNKTFKKLFNGLEVGVPSFKEVQTALFRANQLIMKEHADWEKSCTLQSRMISLTMMESGEEEGPDTQTELDDFILEETECSEVGVMPDLNQSFEVRPRPGLGSREPAPQTTPAQVEWASKQVNSMGTPPPLMVMRAMYGTYASELPWAENPQGQFSGHPFGREIKRIMDALAAPRTDYSIGLVDKNIHTSTMLLGSGQEFYHDKEGREFIVMRSVYDGPSIMEKWAEDERFQKFPTTQYEFFLDSVCWADKEKPVPPGRYYVQVVNPVSQQAFNIGLAHFPEKELKSIQPGYIIRKKKVMLPNGFRWEALVDHHMQGADDMPGEQALDLLDAISKLGNRPAPVFIEGELHFRQFSQVFPKTMAFLLEAFRKFENGEEQVDEFSTEDCEGADGLWDELSKYQESQRLGFLDPILSGPLDAFLSQAEEAFTLSDDLVGEKIWGPDSNQSFYQAHLAWGNLQPILDEVRLSLNSVVVHRPKFIQFKGFWDENGLPYETFEHQAQLTLLDKAFGFVNDGGKRETSEMRLDRLGRWLTNSIYSGQPRIWEKGSLGSPLTSQGFAGDIMAMASARIYFSLPDKLKSLWEHYEVTNRGVMKDLELAFRRLVSVEQGESNEVAKLLLSDFVFAVRSQMGSMSPLRILQKLKNRPLHFSKPKNYSPSELLHYRELAFKVQCNAKLTQGEKEQLADYKLMPRQLRKDWDEFKASFDYGVLQAARVKKVFPRVLPFYKAEKSSDQLVELLKVRATLPVGAQQSWSKAMTSLLEGGNMTEADYLMVVL